jgi:ribose 5-phosphate isomerase A
MDGMLVGLGTGSTIAYFIEALAKRCEKGLKITAITSSIQSLHQAQSLNIPLLDPSPITKIDVVIDGADEIDHEKNMIKGGGGALLREKLIALAAKEMIVIVDETKLVEQIGSFPVPVEISSFIYRTTLLRLTDKGYQYTLRLNRDNTPYVTDNGNYIADIHFNKPILTPKKEHEKLKTICGVLETGLFFDIAGRVIVGYEDGFAKIDFLRN